ncbi:MAG: CARDB domain-containing protein, partial [Dehalococcoidia bacterium]|nr:CARDB domain-containing protein [Dehalococcoidia bacterium]
LSEVYTTTGLQSDNQSKDHVDIFYLDSPGISCSARLNSVAENTTIKVQWIYIKGDMAKQEKPLILEETIECSNDGYLGFTWIAPPSGYIAGDYKIVIYLNGNQQASKPFTIKKDTSVQLPRINDFSATPLALVEGRQMILSWNVTGAGRVNIQPSVGDVLSEGSINLTPSKDTIYTIRAINRRGTSSSTQSIQVSHVSGPKPDLIITDFWTSGNVISYRIKNIGDTVSCGCHSCLYKNDSPEAEVYVMPLAPGEERAEAFLNYHFSPRYSSLAGGATSSETGTDAINIMICANNDKSCAENNAENNCLDYNFGPLSRLSFTRYASSADWQSNTGELKWPMFKSDRDGWVGVVSADNSIRMNPPRIKDGWIQGTFGIPSEVSHALQSYTIPHKARFSARVGLTADTPVSASAKFTFGIIGDNFTTYFQPVTVKAGNQMQNYEVDFYQLAGRQVKFIFRVESSDPLFPGSAAWIEPLLYQER